VAEIGNLKGLNGVRRGGLGVLRRTLSTLLLTVPSAYLGLAKVGVLPAGSLCMQK